MKVHTPPIASADLPGVGGHLGPTPEDFRVDEVPLYAASGEGDHWYVQIQKRLLNTQDAISAIARVARVNERDIGSAGLKDKHAVTTQWLSLPATAKVPPDAWTLPEGLELLQISRHGNKLRTGHLLGNRFRVRLVALEDDFGARAQRIAESLRAGGLRNYFGAQRFGHGGSNLERSVSLLLGTLHVPRHKRRFYRKLYPSVVQSEIFNRYLTARTDAGLGRLLQGEVVRLDGAGSCFVVEHRDTEQPRLDRGDIHLTGPMPGPKMKAAAEETLDLEQRVVAELGLDTAAMAALFSLAPGTRRDLSISVDELGLTHEENALTLDFSLPAGSYATQLVREFTREEFITPRGPS